MCATTPIIVHSLAHLPGTGTITRKSGHYGTYTRQSHATGLPLRVNPWQKQEEKHARLKPAAHLAAEAQGD
jgi:hypothetical protein